MRAFMIALALTALPLLAHPPVSVVLDGRGNVYYSDLDRVWRVGADGARAVVVPDVHTHELFMDAEGNLFGEHTAYEGEKWFYFVWKRSPEGRITYVIRKREGFLTDYSFVRDADGAMYFPSPDRKSVRKRSPDGRVTTLARGFREIRWMHVTPRGTLFFVDHGAVYRIAGREMTQLARGLGEERHALQGLWSDRAENVYVADHANRQVKRITPRGEVTIAAKSPFPWAPAGGAVDARGELILLETTPANRVRVRRP